ncbi:class I SAM-dependent methyltransferase [Sulfurimonas sp.]|nr:class I SAM-dependent methyltransferase [Sulfurimonas sp.]
MCGIAGFIDFTKKQGKDILKKIRNFITKLYIVPKTMKHLENIRKYELEIVINDLDKEDIILEIGAGAGWQSKILSDSGYIIEAIDLENTNYKDDQIFDVISYDGYKIPYPDNSFDVVFSSNVLEHISHIYEFQEEISRVLKDSGKCIHLLPSSQWVFWTNITGLIVKFRFSAVHGEIAKSSFSELYYFSKTYWDNLFSNTGFIVYNYKKNNIFYTGESLMDYRLSIKSRKKLSKLFGSSCHYYILKKKNN